MFTKFEFNQEFSGQAVLILTAGKDRHTSQGDCW